MTSKHYPKLIIVAVTLILISLVGLVITKLGNENKEINSLNNWQEYTDSKFGYSFMYPSSFEFQEEPCSQLGYPAPVTCILTSDFERITEEISPVEGSVNEVTLDIKGSLIEINTSDISYPMKDIENGFCKPGGRTIVDNCRKEQLNNYEFALRELGSYKNEPTVLNAVLIINEEAVMDFVLHFSELNKEEDIALFKEILKTIEIN